MRKTHGKLAVEQRHLGGDGERNSVKNSISYFMYNDIRKSERELGSKISIDSPSHSVGTRSQSGMEKCVTCKNYAKIIRMIMNRSIKIAPYWSNSENVCLGGVARLFQNSREKRIFVKVKPASIWAERRILSAPRILVNRAPIFAAGRVRNVPPELIEVKCPDGSPGRLLRLDAIYFASMRFTSP